MAIEATYGWYWAVDALQAAGVEVHLAAPSRLSAFEGRRVKNDQLDCEVLGDLLRSNMLPEAWISTQEVRHWRELVRYRAKLVALGSGLKAQVHAVIAKRGLAVPMSDLFEVGGRQLLAHLLETDPWFWSPFGQRIESLLVLIDTVTTEVDELNDSIAHVFADHDGYHAIQAIPGVGPVIAAIMVAEIGDVDRFASAGHLASWCGLTPRGSSGHRHNVPGLAAHSGSVDGRSLGASPLAEWHMAPAELKPEVGVALVVGHDHRPACLDPDGQHR